MIRRNFITLLCGAAVWPLAARGQQRGQLRHIGILLSSTADDPVFQTWVGAFQQELAQLGWFIGRNVQIDTGWAGFKADDIRRRAQELVALAPDVILAHGAATVGPLLQLTRSIPIVFAVMADPVGAGYVQSMARPGGNTTGLMSSEFSVNAKFLELLKDIAPTITRVAFLRDASQTNTTTSGQFAVIQAMAPLLKVVEVRRLGHLRSS
jgi:putative ABC transport system substrate-binding protein